MPNADPIFEEEEEEEDGAHIPCSWRWMERKKDGKKAAIKLS